MRILILGQSGQLATEFRESIGTNIPVVQLGREKADLTNFTQLADAIKYYQPSHIINTAAYTAVDKAESEQEIALRVNGEALSVIGEEARKIGSLVIHFSTDYVFDGNKSTAYVESDVTNPINYYGYSKLAGEQNLISSGADCLIFRVSWVYSHVGNNFLKTILRLAQTKKELQIIQDQRGVPTSAYDIVQGVFQVIRDPHVRDKLGIYHMTPPGETNWYEYAKFVIGLAEKEANNFNRMVEDVVPIPSSAYNSAAKRPMNSLMSSRKLKSQFGVELPHWKSSLERTFKYL